jgi:hypothetical protein
VAALERIRAEYPGTAAAVAAEAEIASLTAQLPKIAPATVTAAEVETQLRDKLLAQRASGATLVERLRAIEAFRSPPELSAEFELRRATIAGDTILGAEQDVRELFAHATQLALEGKFDELRGYLAELEPHFAELDEAPGDPARLTGFRALHDDLAARRARVDEEERFYHANVERAARRAVGEALGPGSGLLAELAAVDLAAIEARLGTLRPELRARALPAALAREVHLAGAALEGLRQEFANGGWRRRSLTDPRSRRVREVREVRSEGLLLDKDGDLESLPWREARSDPDWWHQLFQSRLTREWQAGEAREIVALLRLVGATRGAELAREMLDARARGSLQPAELEALATVFAPALTWVDPADAELAAALALEHATAQRLAQVLAAVQDHEWTRAAAHLEYLLAQGDASLLVGLLSDGTAWADAPPSAAPTNGPGGK